MASKLYCIYMHKNKVNNKVYIGQTCQSPERRWGKNGINYYRQKKFWNAIEKYGWDNFEHLILYTHLTLEQANQLEEQLIAKYKSMDDAYGYNLKAGGVNSSPSIESRKKMSQSHKGRKHTAEEKIKLSENNIGKHNFKHTTEAKNKMRLAKQRAVLCINTNTIFNSLTEAIVWCGLKDIGNISRVCNGERITAGKHPITGEKLKWKWVK